MAAGFEGKTIAKGGDLRCNRPEVRPKNVLRGLKASLPKIERSQLPRSSLTFIVAIQPSRANRFFEVPRGRVESVKYICWVIHQTLITHPRWHCRRDALNRLSGFPVRLCLLAGLADRNATCFRRIGLPWVTRRRGPNCPRATKFASSATSENGPRSDPAVPKPPDDRAAIELGTVFALRISRPPRGVRSAAIANWHGP